MASTTKTDLTEARNKLAAQLVKGVTGVTTSPRPSHSRIEIAGKQVCYLEGRNLRFPHDDGFDATLLAQTKPLSRAGWSSFKIEDEAGVEVGRRIVSCVARAYKAALAGKAKPAAKKAAKKPAAKARRSGPEKMDMALLD